MKNNTTVAIVAIAAIAALLVASTAISTLTNQAFAGRGGKGSNTHQTAAQTCTNTAPANDENEAAAACQNNLGQASGHDISVSQTPNQTPQQGD